jgi:phosphatidylglycerol:prolipoprotein diacylglycerol transferase
VIVHPQFDPVAFGFGPVRFHWYGLMYLLGFILFLVLGRLRVRQGLAPIAEWQVDRFLLYGALGVVIGGRLGYVLFYKPGFFLGHPLDALKVGQGGMSFHGGFLGVIIAGWLFSRRFNVSYPRLFDFVVPLVPLGLAAGRIGNFINGELWGREASPGLPWAMVFPQAHDGGLPRHPSQLYEFALEGLLLFTVMWLFTRKPRPVGQATALFMMGYGVLRFCVEFTREPDNFLGLLGLGLSMGQWLSLPMVVLGAVIWVRVSRPDATQAQARGRPEGG